MKTEYTNATVEIKNFMAENNHQIKMMTTEYNEKDNIKIWKFFKDEKGKELLIEFEQFFDIDYFKKLTV